MIARILIASLWVASAIPVGTGSGRLLLADTNGDGHLDLITPHLLQRSVRVHLGDGKGRFRRARAISDALRPGAIAVGDLNDDRVPDLAIARKNETDEMVAILLGDGRGGFGPEWRVRTNASMKFYKPAVRLADLDENGRLDIVASNGRRNTIEVLLSRGGGGFLPAKVIAFEPGRDLYSCELGDMDGDGHLDLVVATSAGEVEIRRGTGTGSFVAPTGKRSVGPDPHLAALGDLDGDGRLDIVLTHGRRPLLTVLLNGRSQQIDVGLPAFGVAVADVNGDRKSDLIATTVKQVSPFESSIVVLLNGDRGLSAAPGSPFSAGRGAYYVVTGDIDEDRKLDIAASSFEGDHVTLLLSQ